MTSPDPSRGLGSNVACLLAWATAGVLGLAPCSLAGSEPSAAPRSRGGDVDAVAGAEGATSRRVPLPRFEGPRLDKGTAGTDLFRRRRGIVYVFAPTDRDADLIAGIVGRLQAPASESNVAILGVSRSPDRAAALAFVRRNGLEFPVIADPDLAISRKLRVPPASSMVLAVDAEGNLLGGFAGLSPEIPDPDVAVERQLRGLLHFDGASEIHPTLGLLPNAPEIQPVSLDGKRLALSALRGKVVVLILFSPACPHCQAALRFLERTRAELGPDLEIVAVSVLERRYLIEDMAEREKIHLPFYLDPGSEVQRTWAHRYVVPDTAVITRDGRVFSRHEGFSDRIEALLSMEIRQALGVKNVLLLERVGYSGAENCRICHAVQDETWALTQHAHAFDTLVRHGADRDPECLPCHTVGWNEPGGYGLETPLDHLEGVQCESCHGRGGPHQSPTFLSDGYEPVCKGCHTPEHSLRFEFGTRLPLVSHAANAAFASLSLDERRRLLRERDVRDRSLFDPSSFVGSEQCRECHLPQYALWSRSAHARAFDSLRADATRPECQVCHTTGFGMEGGYPAGGEGLVQVGCESCHGPGGSHVAEGAPRTGNILKLADKCDSCVLLQICGSCHDEANDPGFEFELLEKVDRIRHAAATANEGEG